MNLNVNGVNEGNNEGTAINDSFFKTQQSNQTALSSDKCGDTINKVIKKEKLNSVFLQHDLSICVDLYYLWFSSSVHAKTNISTFPDPSNIL